MKNPCCHIYVAFLDEVRPEKLKELKAVKPQYSVTYAKDVVTNCDSFCGYCGEALKENLTKPPKAKSTTVPQEDAPPKKSRVLPCSCGGKKKNCLKCLGSGDMRKGMGPNGDRPINLG